MSKSCLIALLCLLGFSMVGCVSPLVWGRNHFGVGVYHETRLHDENVDFVRTRGIGILKTAQRLSIGYVDHQLLEARLQDRSYTFESPDIQLAVGEEAERSVQALIATFQEENETEIQQ